MLTYHPMAQNKLSNRIAVPRTEGGTIISPEWDDEHTAWVVRVETDLGYSICGARKHNTDPEKHPDVPDDERGSPCRKRAGAETEHLGDGRCKLHGGNSLVTHGKFSMIANEHIGGKIDQYLNDPNLLDNRNAIATSWAVIDTLMESDTTLSQEKGFQIISAMRAIGTMIKQHHDMTEGQKITIEVPQFMQWAEDMLEIAVKYIEDAGGDVRGFLTEIQHYYSSSVSLITGNSNPALNTGGDIEAAVVSRS